MSQIVFRCLATASSAFAVAAFAQSPETAGPRPPAPEGAPSSVYRSAWSGYQPFADEKVISWKQANDEVRRIGGWRTYLRESQGGQAEGSAGAASTTPEAKDSARPPSNNAVTRQGHDAHNTSKEPR